jgi:hypothetical protein
MERRLEVERLRRAIARLSPGARDAVGPERLLAELSDVVGANTTASLVGVLG